MTAILDPARLARTRVFARREIEIGAGRAFADVHRVVFPTSVLGVHSVSIGGYETAQTMQMSAAVTRLLSEDMGVPPSIIGKMLATPGYPMTYLDWSDLAGWVELLR